MTALLLGALLALAAPPDCSMTWADRMPVPAVRAELTRLATAGDRDCLTAALDALDLPYVAGDQALVVYRGDADLVAFAGDATGWRPRDLDRVPVAGAAEAVWFTTLALPVDARVDYKLVVDGEWVRDPRNPHEQWGGGGANSVIRMPAWTASPDVIPEPDRPQGTWSAPDTLRSRALGEPVIVRVYAPPGTPTAALRLDARGGEAGALPVLVITDGHEYADARIGGLPAVLDNLRNGGRAAPLVAVFVDPRWEGENRRQDHYIDNSGFADFVATELVPAVEAAYPVARSRDARAILGTSLGGLFAASLGARHPEVFGALAIQSPAFWVGAGPDAPMPDFMPLRLGNWTGPSVYDRLAGTEAPLRISMSTGVLADTQDGARLMRDALARTPHSLTYREVPEGHSWGQWRGLLGVQIEDLFGPPDATQ